MFRRSWVWPFPGWTFFHIHLLDKRGRGWPIKKILINSVCLTGFREVLAKMTSKQTSQNGSGLIVSNGSLSAPATPARRLTKQISHAFIRNSQVSNQQQPRRTFLRKQQEEHTLGLILIGMSALFIFCQSFKIIPDLYELVVCNQVGNLGHNCAITKVPVMNVITRMSHLLVCFNSSANFLIYYLNGEKFRRAWVETYGRSCCCCGCKNIEPAATTTMTIGMHTIKTENNVLTSHSPTQRHSK